jgi:type IV secretory pathway VirB2 component (pilin)
MITLCHQQNKAPKTPLSLWKKSIVLLPLMLGAASLPAATFAAGGNVATITTALQALIDILTGTTAKLIATLAIAGTGYFWLSGRLSLKQATTIGLGIGVIFGAPQIATLLGAS